jgi:PTS system ascorbate-specific IIA component
LICIAAWPTGDEFMNNGIFIIAHAPLASALRQCVLHVFPDGAAGLAAFDVQPNVPPEETLAGATQALALLNTDRTLILTDVFGATPCNVAQKMVDGLDSKLIAGVNLPMLLRTVTYRRETLDALVARALAGGTQGVMQVAVTAPQNQVRKKNDQNKHDHQQ